MWRLHMQNSLSLNQNRQEKSESFEAHRMSERSSDIAN